STQKGLFYRPFFYSLLKKVSSLITNLSRKTALSSVLTDRLFLLEECFTTTVINLLETLT
ncbi:MAG: hypothetical protein VX231_08670, partial [Pseudomonadota bacterium]|nr:hypothetical protein [Pseudomonadota bacterium]